MKTDPRPILRALLLSSIVSLVLATSLRAFAQAPVADPAAEAYGRGDYAEARRLLEQLDAAGKTTPTQLYRLYFAQRSTGAPEAAATLERARLALDLAWREKPDLEVGFYLANAYASAERPEEAATVARDVVARLGSGQLVATSGLDQFRAAKLYADSGNELEAASRFRSALALLDQQKSAENDGYIAWASRWLADRAMATGDWSAAEIHLTSLVEHSAGTAADYEILATARLRNEMYQEAAAAWQSSVSLDRENSDRARYAARLAETAARLKILPRQSATSKPFAEMQRAELEQFMTEQARAVRQIRADAEAAGVADDAAKRKEVTQQLAALRAPFVAAGLEYTLRGWSLQEAAFVGGFAPLIFRSAEWRAPRTADEDPSAAEEPAVSDAESAESEGG